MNIRRGLYRLWLIGSCAWLLGALACTYVFFINGTYYVYYVPGGKVVRSTEERSAATKGRCIDRTEGVRFEWIELGDDITIVLPTITDPKNPKDVKYISDCDPDAPPWSWKWVAYDDATANRATASVVRTQAISMRRIDHLKTWLIGIAVGLGVPLLFLGIGRLGFWVAEALS